MKSAFSYPKINLALDILRKIGAGYHEIQTVFHQLAEPFDEVEAELDESGKISVSSDNPRLPLDENNMVIKAATLLRQSLSRKVPGVRFFIRKRIPLSSGLGGGSSNAVAALKILSQLWKIKCCAAGDHCDPACLLQKIALQIGMDCTFFFYGGTALGTHFGEKITPLPALPAELHFEVIDTGIEISSREAYQKINLAECGKNIKKTEALLQAIHEHDPKKILHNLHNDFEHFAFTQYPRIASQKKEIEKNDERVMLCGSGGALFKVKIDSGA